MISRPHRRPGRASALVRWLLTEPNAPDFATHGRRAVRVIGYCLLAAGLFLLFAGIEADIFGSLGKSRYEQGTGRLIRMMSSQDQRYYNGLAFALGIAAALKIAGVVIAALGAAIALRPCGWHRALVACRILREAPRISPTGEIGSREGRQDREEY